MTTLKTIGSGVLGLIIGGLLVWAHMSDLVELCRSEAVQVETGRRIAHTLTSVQLSEREHENKVLVDKVVKTEQELRQAYAELGRELGAKVDLTIPFKSVKPEKISYVPKDEAQGITELTEKFMASGTPWPVFKRWMAGVRP